MTIDQQSALISNSLAPSSHHSKSKLKNNLDNVYVFLGISFFATIGIATIFVWYAYQLNDLSVLRQNLRNELIVNDIKHIVKIILDDIKNEQHTPYEGLKR